MLKEEVKFNWYILIGIIFFILVYFLKTTYTPTGLFLYQEQRIVQQWDFNDTASYTYNANLLQLINREVQLAAQTSANTWMTEEISTISVLSATLQLSANSTEERTAEVQTKDGTAVTLQKPTAVLDVTFNAALQNGDLVSIYLLQQNKVQTEVYLCDAGTVCAAPGYGSAFFNEQEGWHNITVSGLSSPAATLAIDPPNHIKIDYVVAYHPETVAHTNTTTFYPSSAALETKDFSPADWNSWESFTADAALNGQSITYYYSTDGGASWTALADNATVSSIPRNTLRLKAILSSDGTASPALRKMSLVYTIKKVTCDENWTSQYTSCSSSDTSTKYYVDSNACGTTLNLPADNGTIESCDFCTPQWKEVNGSCRVDNTLLTSYIDNNNCYAQTGLSSDAKSSTAYACDYCTLHNCSSSLVVAPVLYTDNNRTYWKIDAKSAANLELEIYGTASNVTIVHYAENIKEAAPAALSLARFVNITSPATVSSLKIVLYYTDEDLAARGIDEKTLKIYYYNETSQRWQALTTMVNTAGNYAYAIVEHLSLYGLFGDATASGDSGGNSGTSGSSGGGGGGGGGGSSDGSTATAEAESGLPKTKESVLPTRGESEEAEQETPAAVQNCNYVLEVSLPEVIDLTEQDTFAGSITNKGDCDFAEVNFQLTPELNAEVQLADTRLYNLTAGNSATFILIRRQTESAGLFSKVTGTIVTNIITSKTLTGTLLLEAVADEQEIFERQLPLQISIPDFRAIVNMKLIWAANIVVVLLVLLVFIQRRRREK